MPELPFFGPILIFVSGVAINEDQVRPFGVSNARVPALNDMGAGGVASLEVQVPPGEDFRSRRETLEQSKFSPTAAIPKTNIADIAVPSVADTVGRWSRTSRIPLDYLISRALYNDFPIQSEDLCFLKHDGSPPLTSSAIGPDIRGLAVIIFGINVQRQTQRFEICQAFQGLGALACVAQCRKQQAYEQGNDADYYEQLDEREG